MDLLQEHEIIGHYIDEENERVLDRLRRNDSALKELTIDLWLYNIHDPEEFMNNVLLPALDAIATNSSLEILNIDAHFPHYRGANDRLTRALSLNTSLKHIRIRTDDRLWGILDIIMVSPNLEALTIRYRDSPSIEEITAMVLPVYNQITPNGGTRIIHTLKENEHSFIKLDLFPDDADLLWQNKIRLEIDLLTWENHLQVEKDAWVDRLLEQDAPNKELLLLALERTHKVDNE
jgi:hypothetical protein